MKKVKFQNVKYKKQYYQYSVLKEKNWIFKFIALELITRFFQTPNFKWNLAKCLKKIKQKIIKFPVCKISSIPLVYYQIYEKQTLIFTIQKFIKQSKKHDIDDVQNYISKNHQLQFALIILVRSLLIHIIVVQRQSLQYKFLGNQEQLLADFNSFFINNVFKLTAILLESQIRLQKKQVIYKHVQKPYNVHTFMVKNNSFHYKKFQLQQNTTTNSSSLMGTISKQHIISPNKSIKSSQQQTKKICNRCNRIRNENEKFCHCRKSKK